MKARKLPCFLLVFVHHRANIATVICSSYLLKSNVHMETSPLQNNQRRPAHQDQIRRVPSDTRDCWRLARWSRANQDAAEMEVVEGIEEATTPGSEDAPCHTAQYFHRTLEAGGGYQPYPSSQGLKRSIAPRSAVAGGEP
jgi:hypothetical protein